MSNNTLDATHSTNTSPTDKASALASQALADLAAKLESGHSDALTNYLRFLGRFHRYSALNCLLIMIQNPEATHVAGYGKWQDLKRQVRKGEKGIAILAPCTFKRKEEDGKQTDHKEDQDDQPERVTRFRTAYVFDVTQTDGEDLPQLDEVRGEPTYQLVMLRSLVGELGIRLDYTDSLNGARGVSRGGSITLLTGMSKAEEFSVLVHELAHELLHRTERRAETTVRIRELEAEATAYVVTTAIGLTNDSASSDYVMLYGGDSKLLVQSLQHVQKAAAEILDYLL